MKLSREENYKRYKKVTMLARIIRSGRKLSKDNLKFYDKEVERIRKHREESDKIKWENYDKDIKGLSKKFKRLDRAISKNDALESIKIIRDILVIDVDFGGFCER